MATFTFKNANGESINVTNIKSLGDNKFKFSVRNKPCGTKFYNRNICLTKVEDVSDGTILALADGWEVVNEPKARKPRAPKAAVTAEPTVSEPVVNEPTPTTEPEPTTEPTAEPMAEPTEPAAEPTASEPIVAEPVEPTAEPAPTVATAATLMAMLNVTAKNLSKKYGELAGDIINAVTAAVAKVCETTVNTEEVKKLIDARVKALCGTVTTIVVKQASGITKTLKGVFHKSFEIFTNLVSADKPLYFYGPAGCGKSYMAKQIADALGLDYYETSQAMFAHDLKGYGDANGKYVATPFYKAFKYGGVFFLDEVDASAPEALVVLNNSIANKRFDFPVEGMVTAHPNFRVIAAGNTRMTGATLAYTARQCQDTSFKNRFFFELVGYDERIELSIANGDKDIVEFAHDIRKAARETNILQLCSYRQIKDMATLLPCVNGDLSHIVRGSVLQEKEVDEANILYSHLAHKSNPWAKAMKAEIENMKNEEVW
jgi:hypothetical protein